MRRAPTSPLFPYTTLVRSAQTPPRLHHPLRQARRPLRGHRPDQRHRHLAARPFKQGLAQLTDGVGRGGRLSSAQYEQLGGVQGALAGQADAALAEAVTAGGRDREQVIRELLRLVTVDEENRPTRWRIRRDELPEQVLTELQPFIDRRLLTTDTDNGDVVIGVAHEAFLSRSEEHTSELQSRQYPVCRLLLETQNI